MSDRTDPHAQPASAEHIRNDLGQLIVPGVRADRLTLQTLIDHTTFASQREAMASLLDSCMPNGRSYLPDDVLQSLQESSRANYNYWKRLTQANAAVLSAHDDPVLIGVCHFVTERWGGWDLSTLGRVVNWLVAEHDLTPEQAKDLPLMEVLTQMRTCKPAPSAAAPQLVDDTANVFRLVGAVWHVRYADSDEAGNFPDRTDGVLRRLARLLAEPNRHVRASEFQPAPAGASPLPYLGRDASSDEQALNEYQKNLKQLAQEIKDAEDAHDTEEAARLRAEFDKLTNHLDGEKSARKHGHKKQCGTLSSGERADQALRVGLERLKKTLRKKRMPHLADHLDKCIDNSGGEWWYMPPPGTSPWHVTHPNPETEN